MNKKLVCIGGGEIPRNKNGIILPYETKEIDEEIVRLSNKEHPNFLFISIASSHPEVYFEAIKNVYEKLGCVVSHLDINKPLKEIENDILSTDIIYVGGGDTKYLVTQLKERGIDKALIKAYNSGIVCSGLSAGSYCWFNCNYDLIEGMNVINAVNCVHYDQKDKIAKEKLYSVIKEKGLVGYAIDNCVALEFIDDNVKVIKSDNNRDAYKIVCTDNMVFEEKM